MLVVHRPVSPADRARALVKEHGRDAFAWMTTWKGQDLWFDAGGTSYVAYRVSHGVALATGGPVGPDDDRTAALAGFVAYCRRHSWRPCFWGVDEGVREALALHGWGSLQVAEEAVVPLGSVAFRGKRFQDVRTAANRARREGTTTRWVTDGGPAGTAERLQVLSSAWTATHALPEMGFTLGGLAEAEDPDVRVLVAAAADGSLLAVTSWLPAHDGGRVVGWTLDLMRRLPDAPNGVMELLIAHAVLTFQDEGVAWASLSGAPLARAGLSVPSSALDRALDLVGAALEPVYGFRSLLAFKSKFAPEMRPVHVCYPSATVLPRLAAAVRTAYLPDVPTRRLGRLVVAEARARRRRRRAGPAT